MMEDDIDDAIMQMVLNESMKDSERQVVPDSISVLHPKKVGIFDEFELFQARILSEASLKKQQLAKKHEVIINVIPILAIDIVIQQMCFDKCAFCKKYNKKCTCLTVEELGLFWKLRRVNKSWKEQVEKSLRNKPCRVVVLAHHDHKDSHTMELGDKKHGKRKLRITGISMSRAVYENDICICRSLLFRNSIPKIKNVLGYHSKLRFHENYFDYG